VEKEQLTIWQTMSRKMQGRAIGTPVSVSLITAVYGIYGLFGLGISLNKGLYTYVPLFGGMTSVLFVVVYSHISRIEGKSFGWWGAISGAVPDIFSLYIMAFLGAYRIYQAIMSQDGFGFITGIFWLVIGYKMRRKLRIITELSAIDYDENAFDNCLLKGIKVKEMNDLFSEEALAFIPKKTADAHSATAKDFENASNDNWQSFWGCLLTIPLIWWFWHSWWAFLPAPIAAWSFYAAIGARKAAYDLRNGTYKILNPNNGTPDGDIKNLAATNKE
jgi:hypothetical protein